MKHSHTLYYSLFVFAFLSPIGCGDSDRPPWASANGVITLEGEPLQNAMVVFAPEDGKRLATGKTNDDGEFELFTFAPGDGAVIGKHQVSVVAREEPKSASSDGGSMAGGPAAPKQTKAVIPQKYLDAGTSGLQAEVTDGGDNYFEFDLTGE